MQQHTLFCGASGLTRKLIFLNAGRFGWDNRQTTWSYHLRARRSALALCVSRPIGFLSRRRFDYSEWIRAYGRYLDEQLEIFSKTAFYQVSLTGL